jgi:replication-associated recombination protein RarA
VRNLVAEPRVQVRVGDEEWAAAARLVEAGTDEDALARRLLVAKYADPDTDDLSSWGRSALPVALDVDP